MSTLLKLFQQIKDKDFSTASYQDVLKIIKQIESNDVLFSALDIHPNGNFFVKQLDKTLELYLDELSAEDRITLILILMKLGIIKISLNRELLNEVEYLSKG